MKITAPFRKKIKAAAWLLFIVYLLYMADLLFFVSFRHVAKPLDHNFVPFKTIRMYIVYYRYFQFDIWFSNLFGNVLFFMPLGFFLPGLFVKLRRGWLIILISFCTSGTAELLQWTFQVGGFDVDDILLNTLGGICGYWLFIRVRKIWSKIKIEIWR